MPTGKQDFYALLVGIDQYQNPDIPPLAGCVNDVRAMAQLLTERFQAAPEHILTLTDSGATRHTIENAFREHLTGHARAWAEAGRIAPEPVFLFHYSGHGSRAANPGKPEGYDETLVPHDSRTGEVFDLRDWELGRLLDELTGYAENVTVILDCCHSGSGTRALDERPAPPGVRRCPADLRIQSGLPATAPATRSASRRAFAYVLLAACRNHEEAHEYRSEESVHGALTYHLLGELSRMAADRPLRYSELHEKIKIPLRRLYQDKQVPQCEGAREREIFGGLRPAGEPLLTVGELRDGLFWVNGGLAHGLSAGSELRVYPLSDRDAGPPLAVLKVRQVSGTRCGCTLLDGQADFELPAAARIHRRGTRRGVWIGDERLRQEWSRQIEEGEFAADLALAPRREEADFLVLESGSAQAVEVQDRNGRLLIPARPRNRAYPLLPGMRHIARYLDALELTNPDKFSPLAGKVSVRVQQLDLDASGQPIAVPPLIQDGMPVLQADAPLVYEVVNHSTQWLYFALLDFGEDWSVSQLYPELQGSHERLAPGQTFSYGLSADPEQQIRYALPDPAAEQANAVIKLMACQQETDFHRFEQGSLAQALAGTGARGPVKGSGPPDQWATALALYRIVR